MLSWNGVRLAEGYPAAFGELLDYARQLSFDEPINYERFRAAFEKLRHSEVKRNVSPGKISMSLGLENTLIIIINSTDPVPVISKECPAAPENLVLVQINLQTSVEGYTLQQENSSYWLDPSLSRESWKSPFRLAVILSTTEKEQGHHSLLVVPLTKLTPGDALSLKKIGVDGLPDSLSNLSAYVFPRSTEIRCFPTQVRISIFFNALQLICKPCRLRYAQWTLSTTTLEILREKFDKRLPVFDYSERRTVILTSVMKRVCECRALFSTPIFFRWIAPRIMKLIEQVSEGGSTNAFKLGKDGAGTMVSSRRAMQLKREDPPGWMIATTGTMRPHGTLDNKNETKS